MTTKPRVARSDAAPDVFFYGSFINPAVLRQEGVEPESMRLSMLPGYDITIRPIANLVPSPTGVVFGVVSAVSHSSLARLYDHAERVLGGSYLAQPVTVFVADVGLCPVLTYIAPSLAAAPARADYVARIVEPGEALGFPEWYLAHLKANLQS